MLAPRRGSFLLLLTLSLAPMAIVACGEGGFAEPEASDPTAPTGEGSPNEPTTPLGKSPTAITVVSGGNQDDARTGEAAEPLVVRVTDERGIRVAGVDVSWQVAKGDGRLVATSTTTNADGVTGVEVVAFALGPIVVEARVDGVTQAAAFQINVSVQVIDILYGSYYTTVAGRGAVTVPLGTPIEIKNRDTELHSVVTVSRPSGGKLLEGGPLAHGDRLSFAPNVTGSWTFKCGIHDEEEPGELHVTGS